MDWEHVAHQKGVNLHGTWFDTTTGRPLPCVTTFAMDERHRKFMEKFLALEPGEIVEDKAFRRWLHKDFKRNFLTKTQDGLHVYHPRSRDPVKTEPRP